MKYSIYINQRGVVAAGLDQATDLSDWAILDYIKDWFFSGSAKRITVEGKEFVWINYTHLLENMPILKISSKQVLSRRFRKLKGIGLIETSQITNGSLYVRPTERSCLAFDSKVPLLTQKLTPHELSSQHPCEPESSQHNNISVTTQSEQKKIKAELPEWLDIKTWNDFKQMRAKLRAPLTTRAEELTINKLDQLRREGHNPTHVLEQSIERGWRGVFPIARNRGQEQEGPSMRVL